MLQFDLARLRYLCQAQWPDFQAEPGLLDLGLFYFRPTGSPILAVAHLDTVLDLPHFYHCQTSAGPLVFATQLDDRLGVYVLLDLLPQLGCSVDLLLTTDEERLASTAAFFEPEELELGYRYHWVVEFDRRGEDVVLYQYDMPLLRSRLQEVGFTLGSGCYSDIADLHLGCAAFNVGVGYYRAHTPLCYADLSVCDRQLARFAQFYHKYRDVSMPFEGSDGPIRVRTSRTAVPPDSAHSGSDLNQLDWTEDPWALGWSDAGPSSILLY